MIGETMAIQFWNEENTRGSFDVLRGLVGKVNFVLIGGWAVFYYTRQQRSLDIDIAIGYDSVEHFMGYGVNQYEGMLIKYATVNGIVVDLFIEGFADKDLPVPVSEIMQHYITLEGIKVVEKELLLLLKTWGYFRADEVKHHKDVIDAVSLLFFADIDLQKVRQYIERYNIPKNKGADIMLEYLDMAVRFLPNLDLTEHEYQVRKEELKAKINHALY